MICYSKQQIQFNGKVYKNLKLSKKSFDNHIINGNKLKYIDIYGKKIDNNLAREIDSILKKYKTTTVETVDIIKNSGCAKMVYLKNKFAEDIEDIEDVDDNIEKKKLRTKKE